MHEREDDKTEVFYPSLMPTMPLPLLSSKVLFTGVELVDGKPCQGKVLVMGKLRHKGPGGCATYNVMPGMEGGLVRISQDFGEEGLLTRCEAQGIRVLSSQIHQVLYYTVADKTRKSTMEVKLKTTVCK